MVADRKDAMDKNVADLQNELEKLANSMRRDEKDAARKLDEAAGSIRDKRIREMIRYSRFRNLSNTFAVIVEVGESQSSADG